MSNSDARPAVDISSGFHDPLPICLHMLLGGISMSRRMTADEAQLIMDKLGSALDRHREVAA